MEGRGSYEMSIDETLKLQGNFKMVTLGLDKMNSNRKKASCILKMHEFVNIPL